jgi:alpha-amylase
MIFLRRTYLNGTMTVLSEIGSPFPSGNAANVYVARRQGNGTRSGAILVLNNHETETKGLWVDNSPSGEYPDWAGQDLVTVTDDAANSTHVYNDGRVWVWAPPRSHAVWVPQNEYIPFPAPR